MSSNYTDHDPKELATIRQYEIAIERQRTRRRNEFKKECKNLFASIKLKVDEEEMKIKRRRIIGMSI